MEASCRCACNEYWSETNGAQVSYKWSSCKPATWLLAHLRWSLSEIAHFTVVIDIIIGSRTRRKRNSSNASKTREHYSKSLTSELILITYWLTVCLQERRQHCIRSHSSLLDFRSTRVLKSSSRLCWVNTGNMGRSVIGLWAEIWLQRTVIILYSGNIIMGCFISDW